MAIDYQYTFCARMFCSFRCTILLRFWAKDKDSAVAMYYSNTWSSYDGIKWFRKLQHAFSSHAIDWICSFLSTCGIFPRVSNKQHAAKNQSYLMNPRLTRPSPPRSILRFSTVLSTRVWLSIEKDLENQHAADLGYKMWGIVKQNSSIRSQWGLCTNLQLSIH